MDNITFLQRRLFQNIDFRDYDFVNKLKEFHNIQLEIEQSFLNFEPEKILRYKNSWDMMNHYIRLKDIKMVSFLDKTGLNEDYFKRIQGKKKRNSQPGKEKIVQFAIAYNFNLSLTNRILKKSDYSAIGSNEDSKGDAILAFALHFFIGESIENVKEFLDENYKTKKEIYTL
ncbi:MAG: hypothetical protein FWF50_04815 [Defluviitaleaceae bacterium]|nr:hypothetical protein [Defluviitaleaceae bacterium]